ncbi:hypothetical protein SAMN04515648_4564 [Phyllobacterium sp. CL33Tsu]|uniref:hypothetical protein n=1 Tax=Phyllobacterium sp. CL33Tsu TaxID=1798191 RepID=UPI0008E05E2E|nr:hypothetical protein [Phyllobacterium sp. CL33Tsu]SFJ55192.1 hypothetical protein SAMN04515648_4564 [Phyllobacterium sp. CL33Tsu]
MVNRLWIEPSVFRLSRAGVDVFAAADAGLLFNGDHGSPAKFIKGSIAGSRSGSGTSNHTALFGKTYSVKPFVMTNVLAGAGASLPGETYPIKGFGDSSTPWNNFAFSWSTFKVEVLTDRVNFAFTSFSSSFNYTINYLIFDYRIGF